MVLVIIPRNDRLIIAFHVWQRLLWCACPYCPGLYWRKTIQGDGIENWKVLTFMGKKLGVKRRATDGKPRRRARAKAMVEGRRGSDDKKRREHDNYRPRRKGNEDYDEIIIVRDKKVTRIMISPPKIMISPPKIEAMRPARERGNENQKEATRRGWRLPKEVRVLRWHWIIPNIRVRVVTKELGSAHHTQEGVVMDVTHGGSSATLQMSNNHVLDKVPERYLDTALPKLRIPSSKPLFWQHELCWLRERKYSRNLELRSCLVIGKLCIA